MRLDVVVVHHIDGFVLHPDEKGGGKAGPDLTPKLKKEVAAGVTGGVCFQRPIRGISIVLFINGDFP